MPRIRVTSRYNIPPDVVYVGRPSQFGNPFRIGEHGDRAEVVAMFEDYARRRLRHDPDWRGEVLRLHMRTLACFCRADQLCHADVLSKLAQALFDGDHDV